MATDTDTIRSAMTLTGGALAFAAAIIGFVNSRLQAAKTKEAKNRTVLMLVAFLEGILWVGAFISGIEFAAERVELWFIFSAYIVHCGLFIYGRGIPLKVEILFLVFATAFVVSMNLLHEISKVIGVLEKLINGLAGK